MFKTSCTAAIVVVVMSIGGLAFAKSSKYDRDSSTPTDQSTAGGQSTGKNGPAAGSTPTPNAGGDKKVDLTDLESRYWTAKDTEFNVVQNRLYTKAKRFSANLLFGTDLSSQYTNDYNMGLAINYYLSERQGVGLQGWKTSSTEAAFSQTFEQQAGASYNYNMPQGFVGVNYNWVPIYAKLSLLEKKILYFDMSINPGIGLTFLSSHTFGTTVNPPVQQNSAPLTFALDVSQQVFLNQHWAIKLDLDNHFYQETTYWAANNATANASAGQAVGTKFTYSAIFMIGITFFQ